MLVLLCFVHPFPHPHTITNLIFGHFIFHVLYKFEFNSLLLSSHWLSGGKYGQNPQTYFQMLTRVLTSSHLSPRLQNWNFSWITFALRRFRCYQNVTVLTIKNKKHFQTMQHWKTAKLYLIINLCEGENWFKYCPIYLIKVSSFWKWKCSIQNLGLVLPNN